MTSQVIPFQTQEEENLKQDKSQSIISKNSDIRKQSSVPVAQYSTKNLGKRGTVQLENDLEEEVNSKLHLNIILIAIQSGYFSFWVFLIIFVYVIHNLIFINSSIRI
ncbi:unnamed protein product [Paramecium sonneborni]|uniref:Transmembrane protein n=1 Tax=Paramecium sonneborni TaxID=65129 RepID=A0A8S1QXT7_9CILI|nr:unnamed protein product [Paramecium sonneborni]